LPTQLGHHRAIQVGITDPQIGNRIHHVTPFCLTKAPRRL
jgi:hypothetical protein